MEQGIRTWPKRLSWSEWVLQRTRPSIPARRALEKRAECPPLCISRRSIKKPALIPRNGSHSRDAGLAAIAAGSVAQGGKGSERNERRLDQDRADRQDQDFALGLRVHFSGPKGLRRQRRSPASECPKLLRRPGQLTRGGRLGRASRNVEICFRHDM